MSTKPQCNRPAYAVAVCFVSILLIVRLASAKPAVSAESDIPIDTSRLIQVGSIEAFPKDVQRILGRQNPGTEGIANSWEKFNATDVVDSRLPMRRFITGGVGPGSALVAYERGGRGYSIHAAAFALQPSGWEKVAEWRLSERTSSMRELIDLLRGKRKPPRIMPSRRDGPVRELNVSDEEIREIQSVSSRIFPGWILNVSAVVTGCQCEEGPACSDQVWVVAHSAGRTQGLQLSRIAGHWTIGAVQQWWLDLEKVQSLHRRSPAALAGALQELYDRYPACPNQPAGATREVVPPAGPEMPEPRVPAL